MFKPMPELNYLLEALTLDSTSPSGLRWSLERPMSHFRTVRGFRISKTRDFGNPAGSIGVGGDGSPMWIVKISGVTYQAHRVVYAMAHGQLDPSTEVDHINRDPLDNRPENLRGSTRSQNASNKSIQSNNTSGSRGVVWCKRTKKWMAQIGLNGKCVFLGRFSNKEDAITARVKASKDLHGEFQGVVLAMHHQFTQ